MNPTRHGNLMQDMLVELPRRQDVPKLELSRGECAFREGDLGREMFIVISGLVDIYASRRLIATLSKNDIFGEMALIDERPRSATAVARTKTSLIAISKRDFLALVRRDPEFALDIMRTLSRRLRRMNQMC